MPKYRIEILEEISRVAVVEVPVGSVVDGRCSDVVLDLVDDVAVESGRSRRKVRIAEVDEASHVDARVEC